MIEPLRDAPPPFLSHVIDDGETALTSVEPGDPVRTGTRPGQSKQTRVIASSGYPPATDFVDAATSTPTTASRAAVIKMPSPADRTLPLARRSRKSIGAQLGAREVMDKENATVDLGSSLALSRKSRSKSMGPGGLDALKQAAGNRRASLAAPVKPPRSILKQSICPLPEIPPLKNGKQKASPPREARDPTSGASLPTEDLVGSKLPLSTEEEQQAAARERQECDRRDARRKSLTNRRVSFAAEATLHTFHEVEYMQDSTTSTDSTRRASSSGSKSPNRKPAAATRQDATQPNAESIPQSPEDHQEFQQRRRRRSSGITPMSFGNRDDDTLASTIYSSDSEPADAVEEIAEDEDGASSSDSDDGTMMTIDTEEVTGTSVASDRSTATAEDSTLDEALRLAAQRAGAGSGEDGDSDDGEEVIPSFGWVKKGAQANDKCASRGSSVRGQIESQEEQQEDESEMDMDIDAGMDITHAVGRILKPPGDSRTDPRGDASMDVTRALGGILPQLRGPCVYEEDATSEVAMELTTAIGEIRRNHGPDGAEDGEDDEDMSMELTTIIGGVLSKPRDTRAATGRRRSQVTGDAAMEMTSIGRIVSASSAGSNEDADATTGMDITTAIGGIIKNGEMTPRALNKRIMEEEVDRPDSPRSAIVAAVTQQSPARRHPLISQTNEKASPGSPGISAFQGKGLRRSLGPPTQTTPQFRAASRTPSPAKMTTPRRQQASATKAQTGTRSLRSRSRSASPKRPGGESEKEAASPEKTTPQRASVFQHNPETGDKTPVIVLSPSKRRLSGVGIDRPGLGSPQVAALCDRRGSIGDLAATFVPGKRAVAFEEPKEIEKEVDRERQDEEDKENRRKILEREADCSQEDRDATVNLREMINSLSPKWKPARGKKSLHVGSAKGLLGKRPAELLEDDDEAEDNDVVKRLKGHQSSPVKNVRLQQPQSDSSGRLTRSERKSLEQAANTCTPSFSPLKSQPVTTPQSQGRFKNIGDSPSVHKVNFGGSKVKDEAELEREVDEEKIHLQDFLNMTSIRFMELTTTKRRHTIAPGAREDGSATDGQDSLSFERCAVAGACTVPMLELYQHSCRELKQYISEGRHMIKGIEKETFEENPPLFREYMSATPDVKALMDNQLKTVKTHARLLSKAMWYEWRMKLQDGLKEGLVNIAEGMDSDTKRLQEQQDLLDSVLPAAETRFESLQDEDANLQQIAREMADCDPNELASARKELGALEDDVAMKRQQIAELRQSLEASAAVVEDQSLQKARCLEELEQAEKIREKYRGWTSREVDALKGRVEAMERDYGWAVTRLCGSSLCMTYKRDIEVAVDVDSMAAGAAPNAPIDLRYIADATPTLEKEMLLQAVLRHARGLQQGGASMSELIGEIQAGCDTASVVSRQISRINVVFPTTIAQTSDSSISATSSLLLVPLKTKVEVTLQLSSCTGSAGLDVRISASARVVYGEQFNVSKMQEFLLSRIGRTVDRGRSEDWSVVYAELQRKLIARGRK